MNEPRASFFARPDWPPEWSAPVAPVAPAAPAARRTREQYRFQGFGQITQDKEVLKLFVINDRIVCMAKAIRDNSLEPDILAELNHKNILPRALKWEPWELGEGRYLVFPLCEVTLEEIMSTRKASAPAFLSVVAQVSTVPDRAERWCLTISAGFGRLALPAQ